MSIDFFHQHQSGTGGQVHFQLAILRPVNLPALKPSEAAVTAVVRIQDRYIQTIRNRYSVTGVGFDGMKIECKNTIFPLENQNMISLPSSALIN